MKKYILALFLVAFVWFPGLSLAQSGDVDPNPDQSNCVNLVNNLRYRDRDIYKNGEVSTLQDFLQSKGYLNNEPTGYFGLLTLDAAKKFQKGNGLPPTGYVGPMTRNMISNLTCNGTIPIPVPTSSIKILSPNGGEAWIKGTTQIIKWQDNRTYECRVGGATCFPSLRYFDIKLVSYCPSWQNCIASVPAPYSVAENVTTPYSWEVARVKDLYGGLVSNGTYLLQVCDQGTNNCDSSDSYFTINSSFEKPPVVSGASGPQSLEVGETGSWKVKAFDPNNGVLSYSVDWGDQRTPVCQNTSGYACAGTTLAKPAFQQSAMFTHSYLSAGNYTVTFSVANSSGQVAKTSLSVKVGSETLTPSITVLSPNGGEVFSGVNGTEIKWSSSNLSVNSNIKIVLHDLSGALGGFPKTLALASALNDGKEFVTFPPGFGRSFKIEVKSATDNSISDLSNNSFAIVPPVNNNPSITVLSPNGGETFSVGEKITVRWESRNIPSNANLSIFLRYKYYDPSVIKEDGSHYRSWASTLLSGPSYQTKNDGIEEVTLTTPMLNNFGKYYEILVSYSPGLYQNNIEDSSDNLFTINSIPTVTTSSITVLSPNGGEQYYLTDSFRPMWEESNIPVSFSQSGAKVSIIDLANPLVEYPVGRGEPGFGTTINYSSDIARAPSLGKKNFKIKVYYSYLPGASDISDETFTIKARTLTSSITVLAPNGGEYYQVGQRMTVKWASENIDSAELVNIFLDIPSTGESLTFVNNTKNDGVETIVIPSNVSYIFGKLFKIHIVQANNSFTAPVDTSDNLFTIEKSANACNQTMSGSEKLSLDSSNPQNQNVFRGDTKIELARIKLTNTGSQDICYLNGLQIGSYDNVNNYLTNVKVIDLSTGDQVGPTTNSFNSNGSYYWNWVQGYDLAIPVGSNRVFKIIGDIKSGSSLGMFKFGIFGINHSGGMGAYHVGAPIVGNFIDVEEQNQNQANISSTFVSSQTTTMSGPASTIGKFSLTFRVQAENGDIYIPLKASNTSSNAILYNVDMSGSPEHGGLSGAVTCLSSCSNIINGHLLIPEGGMATIVLSVLLDDSQMTNGIGDYRVSLASIPWNTDNSNNFNLYIPDDLSDYTTQYLYID